MGVDYKSIREKVFKETGARIEEHDPIIVSACLSNAVIESHLLSVGQVFDQISSKKLKEIRTDMKNVSDMEKTRQSEFINILKEVLNDHLEKIQLEKEEIKLLAQPEQKPTQKVDYFSLLSLTINFLILIILGFLVFN